jgi:hypothetical protein
MFRRNLLLLPFLVALGLPSAVRTADPAAKKAEGPSPLFQTPRRPALPVVKDKGWTINPIDAFVLSTLEAKGLTPSHPADRLRLLRRVTFDLTGLPPTVAEQEAFLADRSPDAYEKVVDLLLASPRFGERWAQHWLDLVRYAESDGFKEDAHRPDAHKYRDYVIRAINADLPYDRFVRQQLAGDELEPGNPDALMATGFIRLYPDEYNAANLEQRRQEILDDVTDTTGLVFLGLTVGCARCHDHKFDPTTQKDYFRLQSFFAAMQPRDDLPAADAATQAAYRSKFAAWEAATRDVRDEMDKLLAEKRAELRKHALSKFRTEIQQCVLTPEAERTPYQQQIALIAEKQLQREKKTAPTKLKADQKKQYKELEAKLAAVSVPKPEPLPLTMALTDVGRDAPPTHRLLGGDWRRPKEELQPGFPDFLSDAAPDLRLPAGVVSTGRRAALARWLTRPDNPLTARVIVNRLWQGHFGVGIVASSNDFGAQGEAPTHPELLDWLATELVENGWSLKHLHRLMVLSAAYRQDSRVDPLDSGHARALAADPENHLLWHARRRRLEGEALRDAMLLLSGELSDRMFGVSAKPKLPERISNYAWKPDARPEDQNRRSVYVLAKRNMRYPLFDAFDLPDMHNSCSRRAQTTTAPQALLMLNGDFTLERAGRWADELTSRYQLGEPALLAVAYRAAWGRPATTDEISLARKFLTSQTEAHRARGPAAKEDPARAALIDFCHALLNTNEFLYAD